MRIVSGKYRGRRINPPKGLPVRPTTDFAKEALFDILNNIVDFEGLEVLDLFAGTGSISIEFISRGAGEVTSVDNNASCVSFIAKLAEQLGAEDLHAVRDDAFRFIRGAWKSFDLVFADPPYDLDTATTIPSLILDSKLLKDNGLLILEHSKQYDFSGVEGFFRTRRYGNVNFSFFQAKKEGH